MPGREEAPEWSPGAVFKAGFFFELALVLVAALIAGITKGTPFPFHFACTSKDLMLSVGATLPLLGVAYFLTSRVGRRIAPLEKIYTRVKELMGTPIRGMSLLELFLLAGAAGVGEEVLFRGALQSLIGLRTTSLIFALCHAVTIAYFALALLMSIYLGWLFKETGNLLVPILVHWIYDSFALYFLRRRFDEDAASEAKGEEPQESGSAQP